MENNILLTLTEEDKKFLNIKSFDRGDVIFREGELCSSIGIVVSGEVKISSMAFSGQELIYNILIKNEIFGNNLVFADEAEYKGDVVCIKDSTIVFVAKENLIKLLQSNKEFLFSYLNIQSNFGKKLNGTIKMLSYSSAEERLKFYLFQNNREIVFHSVSQLADILHLQRETLSRLLTKLEKENVIQRSLHKISLIH